jgi:hypothetical protein
MSHAQTVGALFDKVKSQTLQAKTKSMSYNGLQRPIVAYTRGTVLPVVMSIVAKQRNFRFSRRRQ